MLILEYSHGNTSDRAGAISLSILVHLHGCVWYAPVMLPSVSTSSSVFGPVFQWDVVRISRRGLWHLARVLFAGTLLLYIFFFLGLPDVKSTDISQISEWLAVRYCWLQYAAVILFTPILTVGTILEERRKKTLPLLLASMINPSDVVMGKLFGRILGLLTVVLTGLPIMALMQFLGGIQFLETVQDTILAIAIMLLLAIHGIVQSSKSRTVGAALVRTYLVCIIHFSICWLCLAPVSFAVSLYSSLSFSFMNNWAAFVLCFILAGISLRRLIRYLPEIALNSDRTDNRLFDADHSLTDIRQMFWQFQSWLGTPRESWEYRFQPRAAQHLDQDGDVAIRYYRIPEVGDQPLLWKDVNFPINRRLHWFMFGGSLALGIIVLLFVLTAWGTTRYTSEAHAILRGLVASVASLMLLLISFRAASTLAQDKQEKTLDDLLMWPWKAKSLLWEKWWGVLFRYRWLLLTMVVIVIPTVLVTMPAKAWWLLPFVLAQMALINSFGLFASLLCRLNLAMSRLITLGLMLIAVLLCPLVVNYWAGKQAAVVLPVDVRIERMDEAGVRIPRSDIIQFNEPTIFVATSSHAMLHVTMVVRNLICPIDAWLDMMHLRYYWLPRQEAVSSPLAMQTNAPWFVHAISILMLLASSYLFFLASCWLLGRYRTG